MEITTFKGKKTKDRSLHSQLLLCQNDIQYIKVSSSYTRLKLYYREHFYVNEPNPFSYFI